MKRIKKNFFSCTFAILAILLFALSALCFLPASSWAAISEAKVRHAWQEVSKIAEMEPLPLSIKQDKIPNAWVTAGQSVTVTTGLMAILEREEEIFGVLAHEAGHAKLKHYESRVGNSVAIGIGSILLGKALGDNTAGNIAAGVGANLAASGFSREQEVAADDFAVDLAFKGEKDPTGLYTALERMSLYGGKTEPSGFNSHPPDDRRLLHIRNRILARDPHAVFPAVEKN